MPDLVAPVLDGHAFFAGEQPALHGDGLVLRPWHESDWTTLVRAYTDPAIQRWHSRTLDEHEARGWAADHARHWRERRAVDWAIAEAGGRVLGRLGLRRLELEIGLGEVVYWVLPDARGGRVTTRALAVLCGWAFERQGLHRLELAHAVANEPSCRVAERWLRAGGRQARGAAPSRRLGRHPSARAAGQRPSAARRAQRALSVRRPRLTPSDA